MDSEAIRFAGRVLPWLIACASLLMGPTQGVAQGAAAPRARPNIVIWLMDDVGFGHPSSFGGPVEMPTLDTLAQRGQRFTNFHSTALCSPSRAALLNGRNHHALGMGNHAGLRTDDPGYTARIPRDAASMAKILRQNGYATWALGKWDQFPNVDATPAGPYDYWPSGQGFERFYGFLYADMDHFRPTLWRDHTPIDTPRRADYHLTTDLADQAIQYLRDKAANSPGKPFMLFFATGAAHAPHHAPRAWREKYRGRFDAGWDAQREQTLARQKALGIVPRATRLPPRENGIPAWNALGADDRRVAARAMEAFAGQLSHADHEFGRILAEVDRLGARDDTIVVVMADNGASAEGAPRGTYNEWRSIAGAFPTTAENLAHYEDWGGPTTYPHYPAGWAMAGNTPFRHFKSMVHEGGIRGPMIISWPRGIARQGETRDQFHHLIDVMPTVLDAAGVEPPASVEGVAQRPIEGTSMRYAFADASAPTRRTRQYFELFGNHAIVDDGWKAVVLHRPVPWEFFKTTDHSKDVWELYDLKNDPNELRDLARAEPQRLEAMKALFDAEARRNAVYPLSPDFAAFKRKEAIAQVRAHGGRFVYRGTLRGISGEAAPPTLGGRFDIATTLDAAALPPTAVLVAQGGAMGGYSFYLKDRVPVFCYNFFGDELTFVRAPSALGAGAHRLRVRLRRDAAGAGGTATLLVDDAVVAEARIPRLMSFVYENSDGLSVGLDQGSVVSPDTAGPDVPVVEIAELGFEFPAN